MKEYHYVYSITYTDVSNIYYGSRTSKCLPEKDTKYWGSPVTFKEFMDAHKATRIKTILVTGFETREEANEYENDLIQAQWDADKLLSLNASIGGKKFCSFGIKRKKPSWHKGKTLSLERRQHLSEINKGKKASIETRQKISAAHKGRPGLNPKSYVGISPTGEHVIFTNARKFCRDNPDLGLRQGAICSCATGKKPHYKGWQFLYYEDYKALGGVVQPVQMKPYTKTYKGIAPWGEEFIFTNAAKFCRDHPEFGLEKNNLGNCAKGIRKTHNKWKFSFYQEGDNDLLAS